MSFHKFPRTRHLLNLGAATRDDLVLSEKDAAQFLDTEDQTNLKIVVEEKVDGANIGISVDSITLEMRVQNRGHYVNASTHKQFSQLDKWLAQHHSALWQLLGETGYVLYGEWLYAKHSIHYTALPDVFLAFDLYVPEKKQFFSRRRLVSALKGTGLQIVREICLPHVKLCTKTLRDLASTSQSAYYDGPVEGIYVRKEDPDWLHERAKIVRAEFTNSIGDHWTRADIVRNQISPRNDPTP